jgi:ketosteroid isomerase-like protein
MDSGSGCIQSKELIFQIKERFEMRRLQGLVLVTLIFALGYVSSARGGDDPVQELTKIKEQWSEAEVKRDVGYLDQLFAKDFDMFNARGHFNKEQMIQSLKDPDLKFTELHSDNIQVRLYGNVAVMTDHVKARGIAKGKEFSRESRFVRIFVREHKKWQAVLAQSTPLTPDPAAQK